MATKVLALEEALDRTALATQVYERVLVRILDGHWPAGHRLNIEQIARDFRVSITPVREALARLSSQRLIEFESYKGYRVLPGMDVAQIAQLFDARLLVEVGAVRAGIARFDPERASMLREIAATMDSHATKEDHAAHARADQAFHRALVAASGNDFLVSMYETLIPLIHLGRFHYSYTYAHGLTDDEYRQISAEHAAIVEAYERRDAYDAEESIRRHLSRAKERIDTHLLAPLQATHTSGSS